MSLKDDFLEALRSVKRDFFGEPEHTDTKQDAPSAKAWPAFAAEEGDRAPTTAAHTKNGPPPAAPPVRPDDVVFEAFRQASAIDDEDEARDDFSANGVHTGVDDDESGNTTPFRNYEPVVSDGRGINDFDSGGIYGDDKTIISKNTVIRGALQTEDSVRLLGQVLGDIECKSNIVVAGKVRGNTTAANAYIFDAQVDGDVRCDDIVNISNDAWVLGNIRAQQAEINGKVKGNIEIRHMVSIGATSAVLGDISTDELEIKRGAFINGQVMMYSPSRDVLDRFDQFKD